MPSYPPVLSLKSGIGLKSQSFPTNEEMEKIFPLLSKESQDYIELFEEEKGTQMQTDKPLRVIIPQNFYSFQNQIKTKTHKKHRKKHI